MMAMRILDQNDEAAATEYLLVQWGRWANVFAGNGLAGNPIKPNTARVSAPQISDKMAGIVDSCVSSLRRNDHLLLFRVVKNRYVKGLDDPTLAEGLNISAESVPQLVASAIDLISIELRLRS